MHIVSQADVAEVKAILARDSEALGEECHEFMSALVRSYEYLAEVVETEDEEAFEALRSQVRAMAAERAKTGSSKLILLLPENSSLASTDD